MSASSTNQKRRFSQLNEFEALEPPTKKIKTHHNIHSIFDDKADHQQFIDYFNHISSSELCQIWNTPKLAIKEIAEYSTGTIKKCEQCDIGINILNRDWAKCEREGFWCQSCRHFVTEFICCGTYQYFKYYEKCTFIDDEEKGLCYNNDQNCDVMAYKCAFCVKDEDDMECDCGQWHCVVHREMMRANCVECGEDHCDASQSGVTCNHCFAYLCERCFNEQCSTASFIFKTCGHSICGACFDGVTCKRCDNAYCGICTLKKCKICKEYFCGRCYNCLDKDDICRECKIVLMTL